MILHLHNYSQPLSVVAKYPRLSIAGLDPADVGSNPAGATIFLFLFLLDFTNQPNATKKRFQIGIIFRCFNENMMKNVSIEFNSSKKKIRF